MRRSIQRNPYGFYRALEEVFETHPSFPYNRRENRQPPHKQRTYEKEDQQFVKSTQSGTRP